MRHNFSDILKAMKVEPNELYRNLVTLFYQESEELRLGPVFPENYTLYKWCGRHFREFPHKKGCISLEQFNRSSEVFRDLESIPYGDYESQVDSLILLCEYVLNFLTYITFPGELERKKKDALCYIDEVMNELHLVKTMDKNGLYIITSANPVIEAVSAVVDEDIDIQLVEYTHHSKEGDIEGKSKILSSLAKYLEPYEKGLKKNYDALANDFFNGVNNFNIRHNNVTEHGNYNQVVAELSDSELEEYYDRIFRLGVSLLSIVSSKADVESLKIISDKLKEEHRGRK